MISEIDIYKILCPAASITHQQSREYYSYYFDNIQIYYNLHLDYLNLFIIIIYLLKCI